MTEEKNDTPREYKFTTRDLSDPIKQEALGMIQSMIIKKGRDVHDNYSKQVSSFVRLIEHDVNMKVSFVLFNPILDWDYKALSKILMLDMLKIMTNLIQPKDIITEEYADLRELIEKSTLYTVHTIYDSFCVVDVNEYLFIKAIKEEDNMSKFTETKESRTALKLSVFDDAIYGYLAKIAPSPDVERLIGKQAPAKE